MRMITHDGRCRPDESAWDVASTWMLHEGDDARCKYIRDQALHNSLPIFIPEPCEVTFQEILYNNDRILLVKSVHRRSANG